MDSLKLWPTPMNSSTRIDMDGYDIPFAEKRYRGIIGSILNLTTIDLILCLVHAYVLAINLVEKSIT